MKNIKHTLFFITMFGYTFLFATIFNFADQDLWHRLAVGKIFFQIGSVLKHDIFSYLPTKNLWVDHEWLSGVIFYFTQSHFGDFGLIFLRIIILFTILVLIYKINKLNSPDKDNYKIGFYLITMLGLFSGLAGTIRCQVFSYLFFTLWIYVLERVRKGENRLIWIFPATMILWANMHGGFITGFCLLIPYALGELLNGKNPLKYLFILAISVPVTLINPYGIQYWKYMIDAITMQRPYITEWMPINIFGSFKDFIGFKIMLIITVFSYVYKLISLITEKIPEIKNSLSKFYLSCQKIDWVKIIVLALILDSSLKHIRHHIFFIIAAACFACNYYYEALEAIFKKPLLNFLSKKFSEKKLGIFYFVKELLVYSVLIFLITQFLFISQLDIPLEDGYYPANAVEFIRINKLSGNLLTEFHWGSYAFWKLYPQCLISVDGRYEETYTNDVFMDVSDFYFNLNKWDNILKKYHQDIILINLKFYPTYNKLLKIKNWRIIYLDKYAAIFIPASVKKHHWIFPNKNIDYTKDKFITNIDFS